MTRTTSIITPQSFNCCRLAIAFTADISVAAASDQVGGTDKTVADDLAIAIEVRRDIESRKAIEPRAIEIVSSVPRPRNPLKVCTT